MKQFITLPKLKKGDQVAVISPSAGLPGIFPWVYELGIDRLREHFGLKPIEYHTTRQMNSSLEDRAKDILAAFSDPNNKAVFTSIGGFDQIKLIKLLDPKVLLKNPKPFFGFSDNTHLHNYLWSLGIPSYYGGAIMTQFAFQQGMIPQTIESINHALFDIGEYEVICSTEYNDEGLEWADKDNLKNKRMMEPNRGWFWDGKTDVEGVLWGGCVESLIAQFTVGKYLPKDEELENCVLYLETSEEIPDPWVLAYLLYGFGERGWLDKFNAVFVGRPKAWNSDKQKTLQEKIDYTTEQNQIILKTIREYSKTIPVIQNLDFGHTDPQIIVPSGNKARISSSQQKIFFNY